ncbi:MGMT family protein [Candidatus Peregrinibacteria bacterium]|nr:MAG: MGMT family protein [Candidatus Peregrinibacteria bacterium]
MTRNNFSLSRLQSLLQEIPKGKVTTYAEIAKAMGVPRAARAVGTLLSKNPEPDTFPCYKVVRSDGNIGGYALGTEEKNRRLSAEGISIVNGKIVDREKEVFRFF